NHQGLNNRLIAGTPLIDRASCVRRRSRLGGPLNFYQRAVLVSGRPRNEALRCLNESWLLHVPMCPTPLFSSSRPLDHPRYRASLPTSCNPQVTLIVRIVARSARHLDSKPADFTRRDWISRICVLS